MPAERDLSRFVLGASARLSRASKGSTPFTPAWCAQHLPLIDAAMDLLEVDDVEFARRCALMREADGRAMLGELAGQLQRLETHIAAVADALGLTAERIRDAMANLQRWSVQPFRHVD